MVVPVAEAAAEATALAASDDVADNDVDNDVDTSDMELPFTRTTGCRLSLIHI